MWDDLNVIIPCNATSAAANMPTLSISPNSNTVCSGQVITFTASGANTYTWPGGANGPVYTHTFVFSTNIQLAGTNTLTGCSSALAKPFTVSQTPVLGALMSPPSCPGKTVNVTVPGSSGSNTYVLYSGSGTMQVVPPFTVAPSSTTQYTLVGIGQAGCSASTAITVSVRSLPVVTIVGSPTLVCEGDLVVFSGAGASSYSWTGYPANPLLSFTASSPGTFVVTGSDGFCSNTASVSLLVQKCTNIDEKDLKHVMIFPNPAGNFLSINNINSPAAFVVFNAMGQRIITGELGSIENRLDISSLEPGIYMISLTDGRSQRTMRMIKN
jgi:hypothetical protein